VARGAKRVAHPWLKYLIIKGLLDRDLGPPVKHKTVGLFKKTFKVPMEQKKNKKNIVLKLINLQLTVCKKFPCGVPILKITKIIMITRCHFHQHF
jgi:hypothetical protein